MRILLVQTHLGRRESWPPVFPLGLCYLATALPAHSVRILDLNVWSQPEAGDKLLQELQRFAPDVVGLSIRNIDTTQRSDLFYYFKTVPPTARLVKQAAPAVKLILGGPGFSMFAEPIMSRVPEADIGVSLEGEDTLPDLLAHLDHPEDVRGLYLRRADRVVFTGGRPLPDFGALPIPRRELPVIDIRPYLAGDGSNLGVQSKRGCTLSCAYCSYPFLSGRRLRLRDPRQVADEIEYLQSLNVRRFSFVDNVFNLPPSHAQAVCEEIIRRRLDVAWSAWFDVSQATRELVDLARRAGCNHFGFSPDSATDRGLSLLAKGITESDLRRSYTIIRQSRGIRAGYNFFMLPGMSVREVLKTLAQIVRIPLVTKGKARVMGLGWIRIEPETEIHRRAITEGVIAETTDLLPEEDRRLAGLFYCDPRRRRLDAAVMGMFRWVDTWLRPRVKRFLSAGRRARHPAQAA